MTLTDVLLQFRAGALRQSSTVTKINQAYIFHVNNNTRIELFFFYWVHSPVQYLVIQKFRMDTLFYCYYCQENIPIIVQTHHFGEHFNPLAEFHCDICNELFFSRSTLLRHFRESHSCNDNRNHVEASLLFSVQPTSNKVCEKCGRFYPSISLLRRHLKYHSKDKTFKCDQCNKQFIQKTLLVEHNRMHTGYRPFKCTTCEKKFTTYRYLNIHYKTHIGVKPYKCELCCKYFSQSNQVVRHKRTHTNEKPYECDQCHRQFSQSGHLSTHMKIHNAHKALKCDTCGKAFTQLWGLARHQNIHKGLQKCI